MRIIITIRMLYETLKFVLCIMKGSNINELKVKGVELYYDVNIYSVVNMFKTHPIFVIAVLL